MRPSGGCGQLQMALGRAQALRSPRKHHKVPKKARRDVNALRNSWPGSPSEAFLCAARCPIPPRLFPFLPLGQDNEAACINPRGASRPARSENNAAVVPLTKMRIRRGPLDVQWVGSALPG